MSHSLILKVTSGPRAALGEALLCCGHLAGVSDLLGCRNLHSGLIRVSGGIRWAIVAPQMDALRSDVIFFFSASIYLS